MLYEIPQRLFAGFQININRFRWSRQLIRIRETEPARRIHNTEPGGKRGRGRQRMRWIDVVLELENNVRREERVANMGKAMWLGLEEEPRDRQQWLQIHLVAKNKAV